MKKQKICSRCILDSNIPDIKFDEKGICNYCKIQDELEKQHPLGQKSIEKLKSIVKQIKEERKNRKYDCIIGVSGGADSTYLLYLAKKLGLRPLAVHLDNGWNTRIAKENMKNVVTKLGIPLKIIKVDWEEFKDLQIAFLKASTPDVEQPSDHGIKALWYTIATKENIKYVFNGHNFRTEGKVPVTWGYSDLRYIKAIYKRFGKRKKLRTFARLSSPALFYYAVIRGIKQIRPLYYIDYNKDKVKKLLKKELGWKDYGPKHGESVYTRWVQTYLLPRKFNIDKRKVHYSALVRSGQMSREEALKKIEEPTISTKEAKEMTGYVIKRLSLTQEEFDKIMSQKPKTFLDYPTYYPLIKRFKTPIRLFYKFITPSTPAFFGTLEFKNLNRK